MGGIEMLCATHGMPHFSGVGFLLCCWDALCRAGMHCAVLTVCYVFCVLTVWAGCSLRLHMFSLLFRTATVTNGKQEKNCTVKLVSI